MEVITDLYTCTDRGNRPSDLTFELIAIAQEKHLCIYKTKEINRLQHKTDIAKALKVHKHIHKLLLLEIYIDRSMTHLFKYE